MLKEVKASEAIMIEESGAGDVKVLVSAGGGDEKLMWTSITNLLKNARFFIDVREAEPDEDTPRNPPPTAEPKKRKRKDIDVGKIMALHDAGWNNAKIADEMRLSPATVGKYIKLKKEEQCNGTGKSERID